MNEMRPEIHPELARSLYEDREEYMINFQRKLGASEVFEAARDVQALWNGVRLSEGELYRWFGSAVSTTIAQLDYRANLDGLIGKAAVVEGDSIELPKLDVDLRAGVALVSSRPDEDRERILLNTSLCPDEYHGKFAGFMPRFEVVANSDLYRPVLVYQLTVEQQAMPHFSVQLMATADVEEAQLLFDDDMYTDRRWGLLHALYEMTPPHCAGSINRLTTVLSAHEELSGSHFRHIGYHAAKVVDGVVGEKRDEVEDLVIDLIASYVDPSEYQLESRHVICTDAENMGTLQHLIVADSSLPMQMRISSQGSAAMVFLDCSTIKNQQVVYYAGRMLHMVIATGDGITRYVPFVDIDDSIKL
jgi:hypothetical protein